MCRIRRNQPDEGLRQRTIWEYDGKCDNMKWGRMQFTRNPVAPAYWTMRWSWRQRQRKSHVKLYRTWRWTYILTEVLYRLLESYLKFRYCKIYCLWCTVLWILANTWSHVLTFPVIKQTTSLSPQSLTLSICGQLLPSLLTSDNHWSVFLPIVCLLQNAMYFCFCSVSCVLLFETLGAAACQASPSFTISWNLLKFMSAF